MTALLETNATRSIAPLVSAMQDIPLPHIRESKANPRRQSTSCRTPCRRTLRASSASFDSPNWRKTPTSP